MHEKDSLTRKEQLEIEGYKSLTQYRLPDVSRSYKYGSSNDPSITCSGYMGITPTKRTI